MSKLEWDKSTERMFELGVDHGVVYPYDAKAQDPTKAYGPGVAWNGLTGVTESPEGAEPNDLYADNIKYASLRSTETLGATVEAYMYPPEFAECDGSSSLVVSGVAVGQQARKKFGLCYRTKVGDDTTDERGYKIHLIYGCTASPSEKAYETINDSPDAITFSWEIDTTPVTVDKITVNGADIEFKPTASLTIDTTKFTTDEQKTALSALYDKLYGTASATAYLPLPNEVFTTLGIAAAASGNGD